MQTFENYNFRMTQLRAVKTVMGDFASFRPDDETVVMVETRITNGETALGNAQNGLADMNLARGEREEKTITGHDAAVDVYAIMKKRYRKDVGSLNAITLLPIQDDTPAATLARMKATSHLWGKLPNPPGSATAFKAWDTMGKTEFDVLMTTLKAAIEDEPEAEEEFARVNGILKAMEADIADFVGAALVQGRNQYAEGTEERAAVESIPTEDGVALPSQGVITAIDVVGGNGISASYESNHATKFNIVMQSPGSPDFVPVAEDWASTTFTLSGLASGDYALKVTGNNSRGLGLESDASPFTIP